MSLYQSLEQKVALRFGRWMREQNKDELLQIRERHKKSKVSQIARDVAAGLSGSELESAIISSPGWVKDAYKYVQEHNPAGPDTRPHNTRLRKQTLELCLSWRDDLMDKHWNEWIARRVMQQKRQDRDMPKFKNWELPKASETLRAFIVEAQNQLIEEVKERRGGDVFAGKSNENHFNIAHIDGDEVGIDGLTEIWNTAAEKVTPDAVVSNYDRMMEIYESNKTIIDHYAKPGPISREEEGLYAFSCYYVHSGILRFLEDHYQEAIEGLYEGGMRTVHVRFRPDGYEVEAIRPAHPLR